MAPLDYTKLNQTVSLFRAGSPNIAAAFDEVVVLLKQLEGAPPPPPPTAGTGLLCLVPNGGFPGTGNGGNLAKSLRPKFIREDNLSSGLVSWAASNGVGVMGLGNPCTMALIDQYPTIQLWEYHNEPFFKNVTFPGWAMAARDFGKAFKAKYPSKQLLLPMNTTTNNGDYMSGTWQPWVNLIWNAAPDIGSFYDGWTAHPYPTPRNAPPQFALTDKVRAQLMAKGFNKPCYVTEVGWSVGTGTSPNTAQVTLAQQAQYVKDFVIGARTRPWIEQIYIYCLRSWGAAFEESFGMFNPDGTERPVAATYRTLV